MNEIIVQIEKVEKLGLNKEIEGVYYQARLTTDDFAISVDYSMSSIEAIYRSVKEDYIFENLMVNVDSNIMDDLCELLGENDGEYILFGEIKTMVM